MESGGDGGTGEWSQAACRGGGGLPPKPKKTNGMSFQDDDFHSWKNLRENPLTFMLSFSICKMGTKPELAFFEVEKNDGFKFHFLTTKHEGREGVKGRCRGHWMEWSWAS